VDRDVRQPEYFPCRAHRRTTVGAAILVGLLLGPQVGCGGGSSSGMPGGGGTPPQVFTTIDVAEAGTSSEQGTIALVVNLTGDAAGYYVDPSGISHGFIRNAAGVITTVDVSMIGSLGTVIDAIDGAGDTVGYYLDSQNTKHSFLRSSGGTITTFDPPNSNPGSGAQSMNDNVTVAGGFLDANGAHGYLRAPDGTFTTFDPTGSGSQIEIVIPNQINASGAMAGTYIDTDGVYHGFLRDPTGSATILDAPGSGTVAGPGDRRPGHKRERHNRRRDQRRWGERSRRYNPQPRARDGRNLHGLRPSSVWSAQLFGGDNQR
jgi:hypothetical protein